MFLRKLDPILEEYCHTEKELGMLCQSPRNQLLAEFKEELIPSKMFPRLHLVECYHSQWSTLGQGQREGRDSNLFHRKISLEIWVQQR